MRLSDASFDDGVLVAELASDPANPAAGTRRIYAKADGFYEIDSAGAVVGPLGPLGSGGGGGASIVLTRPTNGVTRAAGTFGPLSTAWTAAITVATGEVVSYDLDADVESSSAWEAGVALAVGGTIIDRRAWSIGGAPRQTRMILGGVWTPPSAGTYTFEVYGGTNGGTLTFSSTESSSTTWDMTLNGRSALRLQAVTLI